jgi:hypothetical protein
MDVKRKVAMLIFMLAIFFASSGCNTTSSQQQESEQTVKLKVEAYLLSKGYEEDDFKVNVEYHKMGRGKFGGPYAIQVIFNDEPDVRYNYDVRSDTKEITQSGISPMENKTDKHFKHAEE